MLRRAAVLVALGALAPRTATAAPPARPFADALHVEPNECFDAATLAPEIVRWRRRDGVDRRIEVEIAGQPADADGLTLRVRRDGRLVGERRFPGLAAPCEEMRAAVGLAAALAVDAILLEARGAPRKAITPPAPIEPERDPAPPPPRPVLRISTAVDAVALFGVLPSDAGGVAPGLGVKLAPAFDLRVSGILSGVGSIGLGGGSVDATLIAARADACAALPEGRLRARACLGLSAGRLRAVTAQLSPSLAPSVPWAAAIGRADVRVSLAPGFGFVLGGDAIVPMTRPRFEVVTRAGAPIATTGLPVLGGAVSLGPEFTFE